MHYKVTVFIGTEARENGWVESESKDLVELRNNLGKIQIKISKETTEVEVEREGSVILLREKKMAKLANRAKGKVENGDKIWLLNYKAENEFLKGKREDFEGAAVEIEIGPATASQSWRASEQSIFVKERAFFQERNNKSMNYILGGIVLMILMGGTFLGYQKRTESEQKKKFEEIKNGVEQKIIEIEKVRTIDMEMALQLTQSAETLANNGGVAEKKYTTELTELRQKISDIKKSLGGGNVEYEVAYDAGALIKEGINEFKGMAVKDNIVYLWSANLGEINVVDTSQKSKEKIVGDERIKSWQGIFYNGERWYGYDQNKIYEIKRNDLVETEIKGVTSTGEMAGWNALIYVLDNGVQNIKKLNGGEGKIWLKEGVKLSEEATGMSIDSSIWVLGKSGRIYHYNRGNEEKFQMSFLPTFTSAKNLKTSDQVDFLAYVADGNVVVIYGKDGRILGMYNFENNKINDIGIENQKKAVLVLAENGIIYRIKIK